IADYQVNGDEASKEMALQAADLLLKRYSPKAKIIQAWGNLVDPEQRGRKIIDCFMYLPLFYLAAKMTGKQEYYEAAYN
ncbi:glucuronyl hydrolase, partial [Enterococcus faecalis]